MTSCSRCSEPLSEQWINVENLWIIVTKSCQANYSTLDSKWQTKRDAHHSSAHNCLRHNGLNCNVLANLPHTICKLITSSQVNNEIWLAKQSEKPLLKALRKAMTKLLELISAQQLNTCWTITRNWTEFVQKPSKYIWLSCWESRLQRSTRLQTKESKYPPRSIPKQSITR